MWISFVICGEIQRMQVFENWEFVNELQSSVWVVLNDYIPSIWTHLLVARVSIVCLARHSIKSYYLKPFLSFSCSIQPHICRQLVWWRSVVYHIRFRRGLQRVTTITARYRESCLPVWHSNLSTKKHLPRWFGNWCRCLYKFPYTRWKGT